MINSLLICEDDDFIKTQNEIIDLNNPADNNFLSLESPLVIGDLSCSPLEVISLGCQVSNNSNIVASSIHNNLEGLQGGTAQSRYHLSSNQWGAVTASNSPSLANPFLTLNDSLLTDWSNLVNKPNEGDFIYASSVTPQNKWVRLFHTNERYLDLNGFGLSLYNNDGSDSNAKINFGNNALQLRADSIRFFTGALSNNFPLLELNSQAFVVENRTDILRHVLNVGRGEALNGFIIGSYSSENKYSGFIRGFTNPTFTYKDEIDGVGIVYQDDATFGGATPLTLMPKKYIDDAIAASGGGDSGLQQVLETQNWADRDIILGSYDEETGKFQGINLSGGGEGVSWLNHHKYDNFPTNQVEFDERNSTSLKFFGTEEEPIDGSQLQLLNGKAEFRKAQGMGLGNLAFVPVAVGTPIADNDATTKAFVENLLNGVVKTTTNQAVAGNKTFSGITTFSNNIVANGAIATGGVTFFLRLIGGKGEGSSDNTFAIAKNGSRIQISAGDGGDANGLGANTSGLGGDLELKAGDAGFTAGGTSNVTGTGGKAILQAGSSTFSSGGNVEIKGGNSGTFGGNIYLTSGWGNNDTADDEKAGAVLLNASTNVVRGHTLIGKLAVDNNRIDRLQVGGTISAEPATLPNQVVVKSQLDAASLIMFNDSLTTAQTSATLNAIYPTVLIGTVLIAANIGTGMEYRKVSSTVWKAITTTTV